MNSADLPGVIGRFADCFRTWPRRYGLSALVVLLATSIRYALQILVGPLPPFIVFVPAILLVSLLAGWGPGIIATVLSSASIALLFRASLIVFGANPWREMTGLVLFCGVGTLISGLAASYRRHEAKLRESEDRYRDLVEHSEDLVCTHDLQGQLLSVNPAPARLLGYEVAELLRVPMKELIAPEFREQFDSYLERIKNNGSDRGLLCVVSRTGDRRIWEYTNTLRKKGVSQPIVRGMAHDVTERVRAESELRRSEEGYRLLFEKSVAGVAIADTAGTILDCNQAWAQMLGYDSPAELRGRNAGDFYFDPAEREGVRAEVFASGPGGVTRELRLRAKDGSPIWILLGCLIRPANGDRTQMIQTTAVDITQRKLAQEAIRTSDERFRVALKDSPITVFNQDLELRYTWIYNPHLYLHERVLGKTDEEILGEKAAAALSDIKHRVLKTRTAQRGEIVIGHNGNRFAIDLSIEPLLNADGNLIGIAGACMDIARLREITDRLRDTTERLSQEKLYLQSEIQSELGFEDIIGSSPALREVLKKARIVAPTDSNVLLLGETGTGKELLARSIHALSTRHDKTFVKLNCAAVPSGLLESELFGHEKGAFTSAVNQKVGRIELADKGTLFLDEIGELPLELQPKLLRVLQDLEFERLGGVHTLRVDVRIIAATNRDLKEDIAERRFREDLFYRLNVFPIELPPLRQRKEDISMLVRHFVAKHSARMGKHIDIIPAETMQILENWNWPGNIRELENMIERMVILTKGSVLASPPAELQSLMDVSEDNLTQVEREHIIRILRETNGVLSGIDGAANRLGIKRTTLQSMLKRFGIDAEEYRHSTGTFGKR